MHTNPPAGLSPQPNLGNMFQIGQPQDCAYWMGHFEYNTNSFKFIHSLKFERRFEVMLKALADLPVLSPSQNLGLFEDRLLG